ncbi:hypothetical protein GCM10007385_35310 [Tateyamaria omphalii]|uniref:hypothetical protein n=1 Tax=Tateyamaria omphalii TaxID=299262 RepID=UPI00167C0E25|nr:hypothetical protein [Tateyamaria omphalii]GGX63116.1 hypothetical protein GCM10007385_35310 [Tateyamaria omphalii]
MTKRDFAAIPEARDHIGDALAASDRAQETLTAAGLNDLAHHLKVTVAGLRHFAGPEGVMAYVERGDEE